MAKWVCPVCGYVYEGENPPEKCPQCGVPGAKFLKQGGGLEFVAEHHVGDGIVDDAEVTQGLKDHFNGECCEVGMYLAMSRQADREGYPEVAEAYKQRRTSASRSRRPSTPLSSPSSSARRSTS